MSHSTGARVLVVDDEPAILRIVQTNLGRHEYRVDTAASGEAALEAYNRLRPDLVLLDLGLDRRAAREGPESRCGTVPDRPTGLRHS